MSGKLIWNIFSVVVLLAYGVWLYFFRGIGQETTAECQVNAIGDGFCSFTNSGYTPGSMCIKVSLTGNHNATVSSGIICSGRIWPDDTNQKQVSIIVPDGHCIGSAGLELENICRMEISSIDEDNKEISTKPADTEKTTSISENSEISQLTDEEREETAITDSSSIESAETTEMPSSEITPQFIDYPAEQIYSGPNQPLIMDAFGKEYRTRLTEAITHGKPNFGGRYLVTRWGCGSGGCNEGAVIDATTGQAYPFPVMLSSVTPLKPEFENEDGQELIFELNSRLMIFAGNLYGQAQGEANDTVQFYEFKDGNFILIKSMPYNRLDKTQQYIP